MICRSESSTQWEQCYARGADVPSYDLYLKLYTNTENISLQVIKKSADMDTLYLHNNGTNMATTSWMNYLDSGQIRKNQFYKRGTTSVVNGSGILETNITEKISVDNLKKEDFGDGDEGESFHISDVLVSSYEYGAFFSNNDSYFDSTIFREYLTANGYDMDNLTPQFVSAVFSNLPDTEADKTVVKRRTPQDKHPKKAR